MNYMILFVIVILLSVALDSTQNTKAAKVSRTIFLTAICLALCAFAGLRTEYNDTKLYMLEFLLTPDKFWQIFATEFSFSNVYLFGVWKYIIYHFISTDPNVFLFLCSIVCTVPPVLLIYKHSENFTLSMIVFMTSGMYLFSLAGLKQAMAAGIVILGIVFFEQKSYKKFLFCIFIALGFHAYSIFYLLLFFISGEKIYEQRTILFYLFLLCGGIFLSQLRPVIVWVIELLGKSVTEDFLDGSVNIFRVLVYAVPVVLSLIGRYHLERDCTQSQKLYIKIGLISSIFMFIALFGNPILFGRIPHYFVIGNIISLPTLIRKATTENSYKITCVFAAIGYTLYGMYAIYVNGGFEKDIFGLIDLFK